MSGVEQTSAMECLCSLVFLSSMGGNRNERLVFMGPYNGANENDLCVSFTAGPVGITITDYYFPGYTGSDSFFEFGDAHVIESWVRFEAGNLAGAINVSGDDDNSLWLEAGMGLGEVGDADVS